MTTTELKNIAKANGLEVANVGFAKVALYGFDNFEQAEDFAGKNNLEVVEIKKKGNGNFEYSTCCIDYGYDVVEAYENRGNYVLFFKGDAEDFQEYEIDETLEWLKDDEISESEITTFLKEMNEVKAKIENLADDEFIAKDYDGNFTNVLKKHSTCIYNDSSDTTYYIAVMLPGYDGE